MEAQRYRRKPVVVEAVQWDGSEETQAQIVTWARGKIQGYFDTAYFLHVRTPGGTMRAKAGDWIVRGVLGGFYRYEPDDFEGTYEPVDAVPGDDGYELADAMLSLKPITTAGRGSPVEIRDTDVFFKALEIARRIHSRGPISGDDTAAWVEAGMRALHLERGSELAPGEECESCKRTAETVVRAASSSAPTSVEPELS